MMLATVFCESHRKYFIIIVDRRTYVISVTKKVSLCAQLNTTILKRVGGMEVQLHAFSLRC
jgi:hypothetical protein